MRARVALAHSHTCTDLWGDGINPRLEDLDTYYRDKPLNLAWARYDHNHPHTLTPLRSPDRHGFRTSAGFHALRLLVCALVLASISACGRSTGTREALMESTPTASEPGPIAMRVKYELRDLDYQAITAEGWPTELGAAREYEAVFDADGNWQLSSFTAPPPQYEDANVELLEYVDGVKYYFVNGQISEVEDALNESIQRNGLPEGSFGPRIIPIPQLNPRGAASLIESDKRRGGILVDSGVVSHQAVAVGLGPAAQQETYQIPLERPPQADPSVLPWMETGNIETHNIVFDAQTSIIYLYRESMNGVPINQYRATEIELLPKDHTIVFQGPAAAAEAGLPPSDSR